jgi:hypothetical protein
MLFEGRLDDPWGNRPNVNKMVFIGRDLDEKRLKRASSLALKFNLDSEE